MTLLRYLSAKAAEIRRFNIGAEQSMFGWAAPHIRATVEMRHFLARVLPPSCWGITPGAEQANIFFATIFPQFLA